MNNVYRHISTGHLYEVISEGGDRVEFSTLGGGLVYRACSNDFYAEHVKVDDPLPFRRAKFNGDWMDPDEVYEGYCTDQRWNGWACPHFEFDEVLRMMENPTGWNVTYDAKSDTFTIIADEIDEAEVIKPIMINVEGKEVKVYPIGAGGWCWDEVNEGE